MSDQLNSKIKVIHSTERLLIYERDVNGEKAFVSISAGSPNTNKSKGFLPSADVYVLIGNRRAGWLQWGHIHSFKDCGVEDDMETGELPEPFFTEAKFFASSIAKDHTTRDLQPIARELKEAQVESAVEVEGAQ